MGSIGITQVPVSNVQNIIAWNGQPNSTDQVTFRNLDLNNTVYLGFVPNITIAGNNTIPLDPNTSVTLPANKTVYVIGPTGTGNLLVVPGGAAFFLGLTQGQGNLSIPSIHSPNYVPGVSGWSIDKNGNVEFSTGTFRGTLTNTGMFIYSGVPAHGNLIASIAAVGGTDPFGNAFGAGISSVTPTGQFSNINGAEQVFGVILNTNVVINPIGVFVYSPTTGLNNLIVSMASAGGTDAFGNNFPQGFACYNPAANSVAQLINGSLNLIPNSVANWLADVGLSVITIASSNKQAAGMIATDGTTADISGFDLFPDASPLIITRLNNQLVACDPSTAVGSPSVPETWHLMTPLLNGWVTQAGLVVCKYRLVPSPAKTVEIIGALTATAATSTTFFTLPANYRPLNVQQFACVASAGVPAGTGPGINCDTAGNLSLNHGTIGAANNYQFHGFIALDA